EKGPRAVSPRSRRRLGPLLRRFILDHHDRIPDLDLSMGDRPVGAGEAHALDRVEHRPIEFERLDAASNNQTRRDATVRIRDRLWRGFWYHMKDPPCRAFLLPLG